MQKELQPPNQIILQISFTLTAHVPRNSHVKYATSQQRLHILALVQWLGVLS